MIKKKSEGLAAVLGFVFGPFSTLYFGWKTCIYAVVAYMLSFLIVDFIVGIYLPYWFRIVPQVFFAVYNTKFVRVHNEFADVLEECCEEQEGCEEALKLYKKDMPLIHGINIFDWLLVIYAISSTLEKVIYSFGKGRIWQGIIGIVLIPFIIWGIFWVSDIIKGLIGGIAFIKDKLIEKKMNIGRE